MWEYLPPLPSGVKWHMFCIINDFFSSQQRYYHPRRPSGSQSGRKRPGTVKFAKETPGTDSHRTISKTSSRCLLLIGHKKCFVSLCPVGEQFILPQKIFNFVHSKTLFSALVMRYGSENGKQMQVTIIKITESKENKSIHRLAVSGSTGPGGEGALHI